MRNKAAIIPKWSGPTPTALTTGSRIGVVRSSAGASGIGPPRMLIFLAKPISLALLIGAVIFLLLPTLLAKSQQFRMARKTSAEGA